MHTLVVAEKPRRAGHCRVLGAKDRENSLIGGAAVTWCSPSGYARSRRSWTSDIPDGAEIRRLPEVMETKVIKKTRSRFRQNDERCCRYHLRDRPGREGERSSAIYEGCRKPVKALPYPDGRSHPLGLSLSRRRIYDALYASARVGRMRLAHR
ncbi:MAG: hypothetical protein ACLUI3_07850 [Christensenellales bacterium]